jgi:hypothetical protein
MDIQFPCFSIAGITKKPIKMFSFSSDLEFAPIFTEQWLAEEFVARTGDRELRIGVISHLKMFLDVLDVLEHYEITHCGFDPRDGICKDVRTLDELRNLATQQDSSGEQDGNGEQ